MNKNKDLHVKNKNGITLISLVITVVVMLIISGVAISVLTGQEGMFSKVSDATKEYKKQSLIELVKSAELALELDVILSENTANPIEKNIENLMNKIKEMGKFKDNEIETDAYIEGEIRYTRRNVCRNSNNKINFYR